MPYKGASQAMASVLGGHNDFFAGGGNGRKPEIGAGGQDPRGGHLQPREIPPCCPRCPPSSRWATISPSVRAWESLAPAGLAPAKEKKLEKAFLDASHDKSFVEMLTKMALPFDRKDGAGFKKDAALEYKELGEVLQDLGMKKY